MHYLITHASSTLLQKQERFFFCVCGYFVSLNIIFCMCPSVVALGLFPVDFHAKMRQDIQILRMHYALSKSNFN